MINVTPRKNEFNGRPASRGLELCNYAIFAQRSFLLITNLTTCKKHDGSEAEDG